MKLASSSEKRIETNHSCTACLGSCGNASTLQVEQGFLDAIYMFLKLLFIFPEKNRKYSFREEQTGLTEERTNPWLLTFFELTVRFMV